MSEDVIVDLTGMRFGSLVAIKSTNKKGIGHKWLCKCDCGAEKEVNRYNLINGLIKTCGSTIHKISEKKCSYLNCAKPHYGKGLCQEHYSASEEVKKARSENAKKRDKTPKRREQKAKNQQNYSKSTKGLYAVFLRKMKKEEIHVELSMDEYEKIRSSPCSECSVDQVNFTGVGVLCNSDVANKDTVKSICNRCRLKKPLDSFNVIKHCKNLLRKQWKRNPHASLAISMSRNTVGAYICGGCGVKMKAKDYELDHKDPIHPIDGRNINLEEFAKRTYCDSENLMVLCKECHKKKTKRENFIRDEFKRMKESSTASIYKDLDGKSTEEKVAFFSKMYDDYMVHKEEERLAKEQRKLERLSKRKNKK